VICGIRNTRCVNFNMGQRNELRVAVSALTCPMPANSRRSTQPALWPRCPPALHIFGPRPAKRNFPVFPPRGRAKLQLSRKPSRSPSRFPRHLPLPAHHRIRPQLIAIWNQPAKQLRRSPSTGSRSSPAVPGQSCMWAQEAPGIRPIPARSRCRGVGGGVGRWGFTQSHRAWGGACPRAGTGGHVSS